MMRLCSLLTAVLCAVAPAYAQKRAFTLEDLYRVRSIGDLQVSPDGTRAAYTVTTSDLPRGKRTTHIWLLEMASGQSRQLTFERLQFARPSSRRTASRSPSSPRATATRNLYLLPLDGRRGQAAHAHLDRRIRPRLVAGRQMDRVLERRLPRVRGGRCVQQEDRRDDGRRGRSRRTWPTRFSIGTGRRGKTASERTSFWPTSRRPAPSAI